MGGSATSENVCREGFLSKGSGFIIYELAKARGGEATLSLIGFDVPGDARSGAEQGIAARTLLGGCWLRLVDLMVVLAGQTLSEIGREQGQKTDLLTIQGSLGASTT